MPLIKSGSRAAMSRNISEMVHAGHPQKQAIAAAYHQARQYGAKFAQQGGRMRSEAAEYEKARRDLPTHMPVTIAEDLMGRFSPSIAQENARTDAIRQGDLDTMKSTGYDYPLYPEGQRRGGPARFQAGGASWIERNAARALTHEGSIRSPVPGRTDSLPITVGGGAYVLPADHVAAVGQGNTQAGSDILNRMFKLGPYGGSPLGRGIGATTPKIRSQAPRVGRLVANPHFAHGGHHHHGKVDIVAAGGEYVIPPHKVAEIGGGSMEKGHKILDQWVLHTRKKHIKTLRGLKPPKK